MATQRRKISIIIADDHPVFRMGMEVALKTMHFVSDISQASNGVEVIKLLTKKHYDVVLMDIIMAPMDGIKTTEVITEKYPGTKVIAISMSDEEKHVSDIIQKGGVGYLLKEADTKEIEEAITDVVNGGTHFSKQATQILYEQFIRPKNTDDILKGNFRDIVFLICNEFKSEEIAAVLFLSPRTIETYRRRILTLTKTKNTIALVSYGISHGLLHDMMLKNKFAKALSGKNKAA